MPWSKGEPLLSRIQPELRNADLEAVLGPALDALAATGVEVDALRSFAELWDAGGITLRDLLPAPGRLGAGRLPGVPASGGEPRPPGRGGPASA